MHVDHDTVSAALARWEGSLPRLYRTGINRGETAWNPASTKAVVDGPALLEYRQYADGGIVLHIDRPVPPGTAPGDVRRVQQAASIARHPAGKALEQ